MSDSGSSKESPFDEWVYIPTSQLASLRLEHLYSTIAPAITTIGSRALVDTPTSTGYTEWSGAWCDAQVFLGWQWGRMRNALVILSPENIRTNVVLLRVGGEPVSTRLAPAYFLEHIETLCWQDRVWSLLEEDEAILHNLN
jgi:Domain of unknown function (DUF4902)